MRKIVLWVYLLCLLSFSHSCYAEVLLRGVRFDPSDPTRFEFIFTQAGKNKLDQAEAKRLVRYFFAGLALPPEDIRVNLSPLEENHICSDILATTDLGRDMLEQDHILKRFAAALTDPATSRGQRYWQNATDRSLQKIWIIPDKAVVYEDARGCVIKEATLMVESDNKTAAIQDVILPAIHKAVNVQSEFSRLRQFYNALILSVWFKEKFSEGFYQGYIGQEHIAGIDLKDNTAKVKVYRAYLDTFRNGVYNLVRTQKTGNKILRRRYVAGGIIPVPKKVVHLSVADAVRSGAIDDPDTITCEAKTWPPKGTEFTYAYKDGNGIVWNEPSGFSGYWKVRVDDNVNLNHAWAALERVIKSFDYAVLKVLGKENMTGEWEVVADRPNRQDITIAGSPEWGLKVSVTKRFLEVPLERQRILFALAIGDPTLPVEIFNTIPVEKKDKAVGVTHKKVVVMNNPLKIDRRDDRMMLAASLHLATYLKNKGLDAAIDNTIYYENNEFCKDYVDKLISSLSDADMVCISQYDTTLSLMSHLIAAIRIIRPDITIAIGGPTTTITPEQGSAYVEEHNIAYRGDIEAGFDQVWPLLSGPVTLSDLVKAKGVGLRRNNEFYFAALDKTNRMSEEEVERRRIDFSFLTREDAVKGFGFNTGLGCRGNCSFCATGAGKTMRNMSPEAVLDVLYAYQARLEELVREGGPLGPDAWRVHFYNDSFLEDHENALAVLAAIKRAQDIPGVKRLHLVISNIQARMDSFLLPKQHSPDRVFIERLSAFASCFDNNTVKLLIGTESLVDKELRLLGKGRYAYGDVCAVIGAFERYGIINGHYLILSNHDSSPKDTLLTLVRAFILASRNQYCIFPSTSQNPVLLFHASTAVGRQLAAGKIIPASLHRRNTNFLHPYREYDMAIYSGALAYRQEMSGLPGILLDFYRTMHENLGPKEGIDDRAYMLFQLSFAIDWFAESARVAGFDQCRFLQDPELRQQLESLPQDGFFNAGSEPRFFEKWLVIMEQLKRIDAGIAELDRKIQVEAKSAKMPAVSGGIDLQEKKFKIQRYRNSGAEQSENIAASNRDGISLLTFSLEK